MRKLIIFLTLFWCSLGFGQTATNKIQNMATIMLTNSTLYVGGTNNGFNATKYPQGDILRLWGADGVLKMIPTGPHGRANIYWVTNVNELTPSWSIGQDFTGINEHMWGVQNNIDNTLPFTIISNQQVRFQIPLVVVSSNMFITNNLTVNGVIINAGGAVPSVLSTNVMSDFPLIAAASFSDISYPLTGTITNMVSNLGNPATEDGSLIVDSSIPSNGFVRIRARNVGSLAIDQGNLPYRIHVTKTPD